MVAEHAAAHFELFPLGGRLALGVVGVALGGGEPGGRRLVAEGTAGAAMALFVQDVGVVLVSPPLLGVRTVLPPLLVPALPLPRLSAEDLLLLLPEGVVSVETRQRGF